MKKTIGILGGMGPYASSDFHRQILDHTSAKIDSDHFDIIHYSAVSIPSRTRAILGIGDSPVPSMTKAINALAKAGADFVVVPCNSAHYFYEEVAPNIDIQWLNIIAITAEKIKSVNLKKPLILGGYVTINKKTYDSHIKNAVYLDDSDNNLIHGPEGKGGLIGEIKLTNTLTPESKKQFEEILEKNRDKFDSVVLACTELPVVFAGEELNGIPLINPNLEYVKATIEYAKN